MQKKLHQPFLLFLSHSEISYAPQLQLYDDMDVVVACPAYPVRFLGELLEGVEADCNAHFSGKSDLHLQPL